MPSTVRYLDQKSPYSNPNPNWLHVTSLPRIGNNFDFRAPNSFHNGSLTAYFVLDRNE